MAMIKFSTPEEMNAAIMNMNKAVMNEMSVIMNRQ